MTSGAVRETAKPAEALPRYDLVVLSPHLDDAALSCGGTIHRCSREGGRALVVTLFAGDVPEAPSPFARTIEQIWQLGPDLMEKRRAEDDRAMAILGAEATRWDLVDALYRTTPGGIPRYQSFKALRGGVRDGSELLREVVARLGELPSTARLLAPLGVGGHVDHQLTRRATENVFGGAPALRFYEDYPYARSRFALRRALGRRRRWIAEREELEEPDIEARCASVLAYPSQLGSAFAGERDVRRQLRLHVSKRGGERFWRRK